MSANGITNSSSHDVFLSYNTADHSVVENIARRLRDAGLNPFLDRWNLAPGRRWRSELEEMLRQCNAIAIFVGPAEMGSWQQREVDIALDLQSRNPNLPVIPVLLPGCEPPLGFLRQLTWVDLRTQTLDLGISILVNAARGESPGADLQKHVDDIRASICPYRGLLHFREEDAPFFFGREAAIDKLMEAVQREPFVAVVGASGSGKSSVVLAGLVPRLRSDRATAWETVILVPTDQPLKALARALVPLLEPTMGEVARLGEATTLADNFRSGRISLDDTVERILEKQSGTDRVLIVVDQFEELYTLTSDDEARRRFLDELLAASSRVGSKVKVALTLRGDFVGKALAYRPLSDRLQDAQINLGPMTREELECAIRKPAEKIQLEFEPGLVRRILNDVGDEPGNLPLLEFVLKELWDKRRGRVLLNETYDAIGGLQGAVATKADRLLRGLSPEEQKILQRVFLRIVRPSESGLDTRRRAAFTELPPEGTNLVVMLANERLLVTNQSDLERTVEVAHEALISNWSTLRAWVNEDREFLLWRERLGTLLAEWERAEENAETLLRGPLLTEAQKWFDQRIQDLAEEEQKFITVSRQEQDRQVREAIERHEHDIKAGQKLAEALRDRAEEAEKREQEQKENARKLRQRALAAVFLLATSVFMWWQSQSAFEEAAKQARVADVQRLQAEKQTQIANREKLQANHARDQADGLIDYMLGDLRDKLEPIGRLDALDDVAHKAREYLDSLTNELVTTPRLEQQSVLLNNLGNVLVAQGKLKEGLDVYQRALEIAKRVAEQEKSNTGYQRRLSVSYENVGNVQLARGKLQEGLETYEQALEIAKRLAEQNQADAGWQRDLAVSYEKIGDVQLARGKLTQALAAYLQDLDLIRRLVERDRSNAGWQRDLSVSHTKVGNVLVAQGKLREAFDAYQQRLAIAKQLAERDRSNAGWQRDLSVSHESVGDALVAQGKLQEALNAYKEGLAIAERLANRDEVNAGWQRDLSLSHERVGDVLLAQGRLPEAFAAYQQSLKIRQTLTEQDKFNAGWQRDLSVSFEKLGRSLSAQDKLQEALTACQQSLSIRRALVEQDESNAGWQRDLSVGQAKIGDVLRRQHSFEEALAAYQESLSIRRTLAEKDKSNACWQSDLAASYNSIGDVLQSQLNLPEALVAYQQSLSIRRTLAEQDRSNADWQSDLAASYTSVGDVLRLQKMATEAWVACQQSLSIRRTLAEQDRSNADWQSDLAASYTSVGDVLQLQEKPTEALEEYQQSLSIRRALAEQDTSNTCWQRDLIVSYLNVGTVTANIRSHDNLARARGYIKIGISVAETYLGQDRQNLLDALHQTLQNLLR